MNFSHTTKHYVTISLDSELTTQLMCLSFLTDQILEGFDEGVLTGMILIDPQKTFDMINHEIFLKKLEAIVFFFQCIQLFQSYLCE